MKYIRLIITIQNEFQEPLIAELSEMEFDGFQQLDDELITYIPRERFHIGDRERIERLLVGFPGEGFIRSEEVVADQNWNEEWEKTIKAQQIGPFLVKPTWSGAVPDTNQILLEIDPKMAFGTGYHETTRLILKQLPEAIKQGDTVLDAGTGTGILAIAAVKLGAKSVFAFDTENWSITNVRENVYLNEVPDQITVRKGSAETIPTDHSFDIVLANIERNVILELLPAFSTCLKAGGRLLISGILQTDEDSVKEKLSKYGFIEHKSFQQNEWIAIWTKKKID